MSDGKEQEGFATLLRTVEDNVLFSSRVRIARNLSDEPFPWKSSGRVARSLSEKILTKFPSSLKGIYRAIPVDTIPRLERRVMVERRLMSPEFARGGPGRVILFFPKDSVQILINEEDHFRFQIIGKRYDFFQMWEILNQYDDILSEYFDFAFHPSIGYLTSCPTNIGTGLRVSVLLCLPALCLSGENVALFSALERAGILIRGFYGEGSRSMGYLYQVSTGSCEGKDELSLIEEFEAVVRTILDQEEKALFTLELERIVPLLQKALVSVRRKKNLKCTEAFRTLSLLRLSEKLGIISRLERLDELFVLMLPAGIRKRSGYPMNAEEVNRVRADLLREEIGGIYV
ncbi:MAG: hypothetical protein WDA18_05960 [Candidatus Ratteibacteria bacterium]